MAKYIVEDMKISFYEMNCGLLFVNETVPWLEEKEAYKPRLGKKSKYW